MLSLRTHWKIDNQSDGKEMDGNIRNHLKDTFSFGFIRFG